MLRFYKHSVEVAIMPHTVPRYPPYKFLLLLSLLSLTFLLICDVVCYKIIEFGIILQPASAFAYPVSYIIGDMIAEIYGYQFARQVIWYSLGCQVIFAFIITLFISFPSPDYWHLQESYNVVLGGLTRQVIASTCGIVLGAFANAYIISKFKILMNGKHFWLRNLLATAIGEGIICVVAYTILFHDKYSLSHLIYFMSSAWLYKCFYATLMVFPVSWIVCAIKRKEGFDIYDYNVNYNPFILSVESTTSLKKEPS